REAVDQERILARAEPLHALEPRVTPVGLDREQTAGRGEAARERREDLLGLEVRGHAGPPGLRREDEVVAAMLLADMRDDVVEEELVVLAVDDQDGRPHVGRVARLRARPRRPALVEERTERVDLL